jgi:hypothetical protein
MQRRKAIASAGAVTAIATAAVIALGANFGIFGLTQEDSNVGKFPAVGATSSSPVTTSPSSAPSGLDDDHAREPGDDHDDRREAGDDHDDRREAGDDHRDEDD